MAEPVLRLLEEQHALQQPKPRLAAVGSLLAHAAIALLLFVVPWGPGTPVNSPNFRPDFQRATPLIAPPLELTQKQTNKGKVSAEVTLQGLLAKPMLPTPPLPQPGMTRPASPQPVEAPAIPAPPAPKPMIEPPKLDEGKRESGDVVARALPPGAGNPQLQAEIPQPLIQVKEKPKLAFEKPGGTSGGNSSSGARQGWVPLPQSASVDDAMKRVARSGGGGIVVGDLGEGLGGLGESIRNPLAPKKNGSSLELLSDPMGVDFKPYLIRILSTVRRNWLAVLPESVRLGKRGKVFIQFAIDRDGRVPKLVIAMPSGTEAFDRAAVAGISASNPFPPLPGEFRGEQVRLQFTFLYNLRRSGP